MEPAQAQRLRKILRKGFLGKSPGIYSIVRGISERRWETRRGPQGRSLACTKAWKQEVLPRTEVASEGGAADRTKIWGRGHQQELGLSAIWPQGKGRSLGGAQASSLAPSLLSPGFRNAAHTAPKIKP